MGATRTNLDYCEDCGMALTPNGEQCSDCQNTPYGDPYMWEAGQ